ncbi:hypothetical protein GCK72_022547 [Caenorhabditis remanei]|uniref:Uncharacterized protein n=1 Tax=Caenorhabditis remanei TaxID=31234 RepID=A0A6A5FUB8_CAERE|nr:hypothetical protein GCK72_022547 [Caenorhabditis remanei]KAF1746095.1 hypothetical protein GCK72_022547 [Caenorhabditis remanei]
MSTLGKERLRYVINALALFSSEAGIPGLPGKYQDCEETQGMKNNGGLSGLSGRDTLKGGSGINENREFD